MLEILGEGDLDEVIDLYRHLHRADEPLPVPTAKERWAQILAMPGHLVFGKRESGKLIASCVLQVIPNLTRGGRPYGLMENVVVHPYHRRHGVGRAVVQAALAQAWDAGCYKVMLLSGVANEHAPHFYPRVGFDGSGKRGYVAYPPEEVAPNGGVSMAEAGRRSSASADGVAIRRAYLDEDLDVLVELNLGVHALHVEAEPDVFRDPSPDEVGAWFQDVLASEDWVALLAEGNGTPLGYAIYEIVDRPEGVFTKARRSVYVHQIGVVASARRQGVGRQLLERVQTDAGELGVNQVGLDTWSFNESAIAFFRRNGLEPYRLQLRRSTMPPKGA